MPETRDRDPRAWSALIALVFLALAFWGLAIPGHPYFDETHYVPAARKLLALTPANREHPLFAKEVFAASIALFGDHPLAWRVPSVLAGGLGLFAFGRLVWHLSHRRAASLFAMLLLASNFTWFVQSRIAMLDIFAAGLALVGLWQFAAALDGNRKRIRLIAAGVAMGLAMASKWSAVPIAVLPGLAFLALRLKGTPAWGLSACRRRASGSACCRSQSTGSPSRPPFSTSMMPIPPILWAFWPSMRA